MLILGAVRSGKSTLARMICEKHRFSYVPQDALVSAFSKVFPQCGIRHDQKDKEALAPFLFAYMKELSRESGHRFVVEGSHVGPRIAAESTDREKWKIVVLGYPGLTPEQAFAQIRENDAPHDWTSDESDDDLRQMMAVAVEKSRQYRAECEELGIEFIDTSSGRRQKLAEFANGWNNTR